MDIMKDIAKEELENSMRVRESYEKALYKIPKGSLSRKRINGREYYYLSYKESGRVKSRYLGKLSEREVKRYKELARRRREYKRLIRLAGKQIVFYRKVLNG